MYKCEVEIQPPNAFYVFFLFSLALHLASDLTIDNYRRVWSAFTKATNVIALQPRGHINVSDCIRTHQL